MCNAGLAGIVLHLIQIRLATPSLAKSHQPVTTIHPTCVSRMIGPQRHLASVAIICLSLAIFRIRVWRAPILIGSKRDRRLSVCIPRTISLLAKTSWVAYAIRPALCKQNRRANTWANVGPEGGGLFPRSRKALKINGRIRPYVAHYYTGVPLGKRDLLGSDSVSEKR
jgi:hypothetical protein